MRHVKLIVSLLLFALVALLVGPPHTQSQPPRGSGGGNFQGGGRGFGGGSGGGGMGGGGMDPDRIFQMMANGGPTVRISDFRRDRENAEEWARKKGITNGQLTKEQFLAYSADSMDRQANERFNQYAQGGNTVRIDQMMFRERVESWAKEKGITGGTLTREQYLEYYQQAVGGGRSRDQTSTERRDTEAPRSTDTRERDSQASQGDGRGRGGFNWRGGDRQISDSDVSRLFTRSDRNQDGFLGFDEMSENLQPEKDKWDTNKDGQIELAEYKEYIKAFYEKRQAERRESEGGATTNPGGDNRGTLPPGAGGDDQPAVDLDKKLFVLRAGKLGDRMPSWFTENDIDKDAQIALYEWKEKGNSISEFREKDLNADGFITAEEAVRLEALARGEKGTSNGSSSARNGSTQDNRIAMGGQGTGQSNRPAGFGGGILGALFGRRGNGQGGGTPGGGGGMTGGGMNRGMGGGGMNRGMGGGNIDFNNPDSLFDYYANGRTTISPSDSRRYGQQLADFLKQKGVTSGQVTRELFKEFWAQRPADGGGAGRQGGGIPGGGGGGRFGRPRR